MVHHQREKLWCVLEKNNRTNAWKNQMPWAGIEPTTHRFHDWRSTAELPGQLQWNGQSLNTDYQAFAPRPLGLGITSVDRQQKYCYYGTQVSNRKSPSCLSLRHSATLICISNSSKNLSITWLSEERRAGSHAFFCYKNQGHSGSFKLRQILSTACYWAKVVSGPTHLLRSLFPPRRSVSAW